MSQTQAAECVGKPEINARRFWGFKALKTLLDKGYTPALSEIEPDTDCSSKPRIFVLWGEKIVFVADIKSGLVSDVPDTNSRMCGPSQPEALSIFAIAVQNQQVRGDSNMSQTQTIPQTIPQTITFDEFAAWYPENSTRHYELHHGVIVEMPLGTGNHSNVTGFIWGEINFEIRRLQLPYFIPGDCLLKPIRNEAGYQPDTIVLNQTAFASEPRWEKESIITMGSSVRLAVEVVSTNWRDDYHLKFADYEEMGIPEYWIVDYLGLGGRKFIGTPKQPTLSVCQLVEGEYQVKQFRGDDTVESLAFPELRLTAELIFRAGMPPTEPS